MTYAVICICLQALGAIMLLPFAVNVKYHFSLNREKSVAVVKVLFFTVAHVCITNSGDKIVVALNGKNVPLKRKRDDGFPVEKIPKIVAFLNSERIIAGAYLFAFVGGEDAMDCAMKLAVVNILAKSLLKDASVYADFQNDRLDFDFRLRANISILQALELRRLTHAKNPV